MQGGAMIEGVDILFDGVGVGVHQQIHSAFASYEVTEKIHLLKLPACVHMQ
ncbi:hypothetical protein D3C79_744110 [compost metagenome]